ncbi:MAG TPA: ferritin-like domain-containing protein [Polyangiaceae bacterium]|nr:ferritin-like domain-containing protein [Polyangiaceae bacterium]
MTDGKVTLQGEATGIAGLADGNATPKIMSGIPLSVAGGTNLGTHQSVWNVESGMEFSIASADSLGARVSPRFGGVVYGPGGFYVGLRGGPQLPLSVERHEVVALSLEGIANIYTGGAFAGKPNFGGVLSLSWEYFGSFNIPSGRPLRSEEGTPARAKLRAGNSWRARTSHAAEQALELTDAERRELGATWLEDARMEHASIAAFAQLTLELLELGAPARLIEATQRAALDETRHARICFEQAAAHLNMQIEPASLTLPTRDDHRTSYEAVAVSSALEGCIGERLAAALLRHRARHASSPELARALSGIQRDEERHARLAWEVIQFCIDRCGSKVLRSITAAFATHQNYTYSPTPLLCAHGWPNTQFAETAQHRIRTQVERRIAAMQS